MPLVVKVLSHVKARATFTRRRMGNIVASPSDQPSGSDDSRVDQTDIIPPQAHHVQPYSTTTLNPSQPSTSATQDPIANTENEEDSDAQALVAVEGKESLASRGFAAFKLAVEVTKELAEPFPPLKYAAAGLLIVMEGFEKVQDVQDDFSYVAGKLTFMRTTYDEHRHRLEASEGTKASMESLARAMRTVERMVQSKADRGLFKRIWENAIDVKAVADALRMLGDVVDQFIMTVTVSTHSVVSEARQEQLLDKLAFAEKAQFRSTGNAELCTEGTRAEFLADLFAWASASDKPRVCWVNGAAGAGKTTIANTLCSFLRGLGLLGGSFFCSRDGDAKRRSTDFIFSTLARSLAYRDSAYARSLAEVLKEPGEGNVIAIEQLASLIVAPMRSAHLTGQSSQAPIRILVIDALDECGDDDKAIYDIIHALLSETRGLPLKFLITSRPEPHVIRAFDSAEQDSYLVRRLQDIPDEVAQVDIRTYLESELKKCAQSHGVGDAWPSEPQVRALAKQAGSLFIFAATACKYISNFNEDPVERLDSLTAIDVEPWRGIDPMYEFVLEQVRQSKASHTWRTTRRCLQAIVRLSHPLTLDDLADLLDLAHREVRTALGGLQSVLRIPPPGDSNTITAFHASFPEYVKDEKRWQGKDWFLENAEVHGDLLQRCIAVMKSRLRFNISNSRTSYLSNHEQPSESALGGALVYSCLHWIDHLEGCGSLGLLALPELSELMMEQFLFWLEVLSVIEEAPRALVVLTRLLNWLSEHARRSYIPAELRQMNSPVVGQKASPDDFGQFAMDARDFVNRFGRPIAQSCPHIYLSALAATTRKSTIWTKILPRFKGLPKIITQQTQDVCAIFVLRGHKGSIMSVAFSPDGTRVVSGSNDGTIRLWNPTLGAAVGDPIRGHEDWVWCVAFSPDGQRVVSGSFDRTIRLWDAASGAAIGDPIRGHDSAVRSVTFSPDGRRIVSGSSDGTIRLWDAATRAATNDPFRGHDGSVWSVAFSPDGTRVVSSSSDHTIRLWDVATGAAIGDPICGHEKWATSVAFSPDGKRVVSGSSDCTIRLWDAATGVAIGNPIRGHDGSVWSVAFSPNGTRIVSSSKDRTIRLWDVATGAAIGGPLRGHEKDVDCVAFSPDGAHVVSGSDDQTVRLWGAATGAPISNSILRDEGSVWSVAYSSDGTRVVSGSDDSTIRLWDATTGAAVGDPICGHEDKVMSIALSVDGMRIVSGSSDNTVRLWDAVTGAAVGDPIRGHEGWVTSVAFSPDGTRIVSGSSDNTIRLWDSASRAAIGDPICGHKSSLGSVAFTPDGTRVVSGCDDGTIWLWDAATGAAISDPFRGHESSVWSVAVSLDGTRIVSGSFDHTIRLWDAATGAAVCESIRGHEDWVTSVAFSPDGMRIVSGSSDRTIRLWDAASGAAVGEPIRGHEDWVTSVAFSPDGTRVVSGSNDNTIRLWDHANGAVIGNPIRSDEGLNSVAFSSDGTRSRFTSLDCTIHRWNAESRITIDNPVHDTNNPNVARVDHGDPGAPSVYDLAHVARPLLASDRLYRVAFSPQIAHATDIYALLSRRSGRDPRDAFTLDDAGWLRGPDGELFLWILPEYRRGLWWPRTTAIMGVDPVMLDLSGFAHGEDWSNCFQEDEQGRMLVQ